MKSHLFYSILLSLSVCLSGLAESSFWDVSTEPAALISSSSRQITLGLQFTSDVSGSVTGLRFYKSKKNTGTHTGILWSASGAMLASVTFVNESASGWQTAQFREPVKITPNTPYVISYTAPRGQYAFNSNYPWPSVSRAPLRVVGSSPGVYTMGSGSRFPITARDNSNYWVDVLFSAETAPSEPQSTEETSLWQNTTIPAIKANGSDSTGITLGLKFQASAGGKVAGVRFYKGPGNTGTHVGSLWSASGKKLAQAYFSNESDGGWQEARFSSPVVISANMTYIVSYFAPRGRYAMDEFFNWSAANTSFLSASKSGAGVYTYGSVERFPTSTKRGRNYWVDVIYQPETQTSPPVTYSISGVVQGAGATISLSGSKSATTVTDGQGSYSFTGLDNGTYT
ncbi:MAG: DUF4082 domain-containing protein, partial [Bryobacterales bacterium]|nr:DUF4082 domain-containing protein [Bryobacterales bacterium]